MTDEQQKELERLKEELKSEKKKSQNLEKKLTTLQEKDNMDSNSKLLEFARPATKDDLAMAEGEKFYVIESDIYGTRELGSEQIRAIVFGAGRILTKEQFMEQEKLYTDLTDKLEKTKK